jgi:hypothetical protein
MSIDKEMKAEHAADSQGRLEALVMSKPPPVNKGC